MEYRLINTGYIESVSGGDREIILELVKIFNEQVVEFNLEMKSLYEKKDYHNLGLLAHKAKSSIAILGLEDLAALLKTFELDARNDRNIDQYETYISRFESDTKNAMAELENYINNL